MKLRLKAFRIHLLCSAGALMLVLSSLYLGWYRWPGWYLTGVVPIAAMMTGIDVVLGPLMTLVIANPAKSARALTRDIGMIALVQIAALVYGTSALWSGRPLYYAFSEDRLQMVQASDLDNANVQRARQWNGAFSPQWYSLPRWIWAPLPDDHTARSRIVSAVLLGTGDDVIRRPEYFKAWELGLPKLRQQLKTIDQLKMFSIVEKQTLKQRVAQLGLPADQPTTLFLTGRNRIALAVFDRGAMKIVAIVSAG